MAKRRRFNEAIRLETLTKDQKMNTREIRMQHYIEMENLERDEYDKGRINDNELNYDFLHERVHYKPLG